MVTCDHGLRMTVRREVLQEILFGKEGKACPRTKWKNLVEQETRRAGTRFVDDRIQWTLSIVHAKDHIGLQCRKRSHFFINSRICMDLAFLYALTFSHYLKMPDIFNYMER